MTNQDSLGIRVKDEQGLDWIVYPTDPLYDEAKRQRDLNKENIVLPNAMIYGEMSLSKEKGYDWIDATKKIKDDLGKYSFFLQPKSFGKSLEFPEDLTKLSSEQLGQVMSKLESYRSFVQSQLAFLDVDRTMLQGIYEIGLGKIMGMLENRVEKKKLKEVLQSEAIIGNKRLGVVKQKLMEVDAKYQALDKLVQIYNGQIFTISREMSRRQNEKDKYA